MSRLRELMEQLCPDGVEYKKFDEVCVLKARVGWQRLTKAERLPSGEYMLVTGTDFSDNHRINYSTCEYVTKERYDQDENIQLRNGDVLLTKDGTLGKVVIVEDLPMPATLNSHLFVIRAKAKNLLQKYIMYYLLSAGFVNAMMSASTGSTIKGFTQKAFYALSIPVPPIEVQHEIVRILDSMQELDDVLSEEHVLREEQWLHAKKHVFQKHFGNPVTNEKGLPTMKLGEMYQVTSSKRILAEDQSDEGVPFLKIADIIAMIEGEPVTPQSYVPEDIYAELEASGLVPKPGDILITARGTIGRFYIVIEGDRFYFQDGMVTWLRRTEKSPSSAYFECLFTDESFFGKLMSDCGSGTVKYISIKGLANQIVPDPSPDVIEKFDNDFNDASAIRELSDAIRRELLVRRKQFEYYRDKLLDLPEKEAVA